jgi:hypothetical protein
MGDRDEMVPGAAPGDEAERRESGRIPIELLVRDRGIGGSYEPRTGNLGIGGVWYDGLHPPVGTQVEVRFLLPRGGVEVHAVGEVLRITRDGPRFGAHVKFVEIPLDAELAIARLLQGK